MTDIVERLRGFCGAAPSHECSIMLEAADEIERLLAEQAILIRQINGLVEKLANADAEIDRLRGAHD